MMRKFIIILFFLPCLLQGQDTTMVKQDSFPDRINIAAGIREDKIVNDKVLYEEPEEIEIELRGQLYPALVTGGDTLILADLKDVSITSKRHFEDDDEYRKYLRFRQYGLKVYPYAKEAIRIFRELEYAKQHLSKRKYKKEVKRLNEELKLEFEEPLTKLTKLQGKIMTKMIERELGMSMHSLIQGLKGRFTAFYWHNFSKLYSYDLKEGYEKGKYEILDIVLQDFDLSFEIDKREDLKYIQQKFDADK